MVDSHPNIAIPAETHVCEILQNGAMREPLTQHTRSAIFDAFLGLPRWSDFNLDPGELKNAIESLPNTASAGRCLAAFWQLYARKQGKQRWGDKTPGHILCLSSLAEQLPEARFVHIVRDGRDVVASMRSIWFARQRSVADLAADWARRVALFREETDARQLPARVVRYEDLVTSPEAILRMLCDFIEVDFAPAMMQYYQRADKRLEEIGHLKLGAEMIDRSERIAIHSLTRTPPTKDRIGHWRHVLKSEEVATVERIAGDTLREYGYEV